MKVLGRSLGGRCLPRTCNALRISCSSPYTPIRQFAKPAFAPKPIIDIKHIRNAPGLYEQNCIDRNYGAHAKSSWRIIELHEQWLALQQSARDLRSRNKALRDQIANKGGEEKEKALGEAKAMKAQLSEIEAKETQLQEEIEGLAQDLPNLSSVHTPVGTEAALVEYIGTHPNPDNTKPWKSHVDIGQQLGILDFAGASQTSGWGWYFLVGDGAMLEQALVQYALSVARRKKWKVVAPPSLVYSHIASACGFQPRDQNGEQQVYAIEQSEKDKAKPQLALAGTAEIPLAGMKAKTTFAESELPLKTVGVSRCYRAEAGARGADTKGLYRVHEFTKVEMFAWTAPDQSGDDHFTATDASSSEAVFEEMLGMQHEILTALGLHCRILEMPTTDLGASAIRKRDIEAFFPSRRSIDDGWGEVTSTSMCTDYQSRRLHTRLRTANANKQVFPFTLNGTALAVPRVLAAILENHWDEQSRTVKIPPVLQPFMGGQTEISKQS
jgi:seryl-tRNA synthetase